MPLSLEDLEKKYGGFSRPSLIVKVDDKKVESDSLLITNVSVNVTTGYEASVASLIVRGEKSGYIKDTLKVDPDLDKYFKLGKKIEIYMGYGGTTVSVFLGNITSIEFEYRDSAEVEYHVEAMDVKFFMMHNYISEVKKDVKKYSEAVNNVLKDYSSFYKELKIYQSDEVSTTIEQHNQSDYDFVVSLAKELGFLFYVVNGVVHFTKYTANKDTSVSIPASYAIRYFKQELTLENQVKSVTVRSNNELDPSKPFEATATTCDSVGEGDKTSSGVAKVIDEKMQRVIIDNSIDSQKEAQSRAEAELLKYSMNFASGELETVGIPDIIPGSNMKIAKINDDFNKEYFVTNVKHEIDGDDYRTYCRWEANVT